MIKIDRSGLMRLVILTKKYAIKFPSKKFGVRYFVNGMLANIIESQNWSKSEHFCPVRFSFPLGLCILMEKCQVLTEEEYYNNEEKIVENVWFSEVEKKSMSYGWRNGRIVAIDYGEV